MTNKRNLRNSSNFTVDDLDSVTRERLRHRVVELKIRGNEYRQIAEIIRAEFKLDIYEHSTAFTDLQHELNISHERSVELMGRYRELEDQRLNWLLTKLARGIDRGDAKAIDAALKITEQRAKLHGLFKDIQIQVNIIAAKQIEVQFNAFFELIASDAEIPTQVKRKLLNYAELVEHSEQMEILN